jgi:hypothetical protein
MILDSGSTIYIWNGKAANDNEKRQGIETAKVRK